MDDKNLHITHGPNDNYPEPDVPVKDAWAQINAMLAAQPPRPLNGTSGSGGGFIAGSFWKWTFLVIIVGSTIFWGINTLSKKSDGRPKDIQLQQTRVAQSSGDSGSISTKNTVSKKNNNLLKNNTIDTHLYKLKNHFNNPTEDENKKAEKIKSRSIINYGNNKSLNSTTKLNNHKNESIINNDKQDENLDGRINENNIQNTQRVVNEKNDPQLISNKRTLKKQEIIREEKIKPVLKNQMKQVSISNSVNTLKNLFTIQNNLSVKKLKNKNDVHVINYGVQLNANVPLKNDCMCNYTIDGKGNARPLKLLIPGIWASKFLGKQHELLFQFNPYLQYFADIKNAYTETIFLPPGLQEDTLKAIRSIYVIKTFGLNAGIQYNYHFNKKWSAGFGMDYNRQSRALINEQIKRVYDEQIFLYKTYGIKRAEDSVLLKPHFLTTNVNVAYNFKKFQVGAKIQLPVTNLGLSQSNFSHSINGQLFLRWNLTEMRKISFK